jgi:GTP-binding protein HflX
VLVGVWTEGTQADADRSLAELAALAETAGSQVLEAVSQRRDKPDAGTYVGSGKAAEIRDIVAAAGADTVICDGELTPGQLNALEKILKVKVVDRTALILDIFAQHASSREGKAQVELAQMQYMLPRLRGWGESLSRQAGGRVAGGGGIGTRGPGETKIETDRRRIRARVSKLRREIAGMATARATQRSAAGRNAVPQRGDRRVHQRRQVQPAQPAHRRRRPGRERAVRDPGPDGAPGAVPGRPRVHAHRHRRLRAAPAAPARRRVPLDAGGGGRRRSAAARRRRLRPRPAGPDRRVHVVLQGHRRVVGAELVVVNKVDAMSEEDILDLAPGAARARSGCRPARGQGIEQLATFVAARLPHPDVEVDVLVPYDRGDLVARVHRDGEVLRETHEARWDPALRARSTAGPRPPRSRSSPAPVA